MVIWENAYWVVWMDSLKDRDHFDPLNAELNPIRHLLALVGARHIVHVSRIRVKDLGLGPRILD